MSKNQFEVGDVVRLNSGGQHMTVINPDDSGMVKCIWMDKDGTIRPNPMHLEDNNVAFDPRILSLITSR